jgi:hypothetical protein
MGGSVRNCTPKQTQQAKETLQKEYAAPFRLLPPQGAVHVIAQADGTMVCTVAHGVGFPRSSGQWEES